MSAVNPLPERQNAYSYDELLMSGHGELFGPTNGRLPLPNMLMLDRISNIDDTGGDYGKGIIVAELDIKPDLWFFDCHFEGDPVMPGCLGLGRDVAAGWISPGLVGTPGSWSRAWLRQGEIHRAGIANGKTCYI